MLLNAARKAVFGSESLGCVGSSRAYILEERLLFFYFYLEAVKFIWQEVSSKEHCKIHESLLDKLRLGLRKCKCCIQ